MSTIVLHQMVVNSCEYVTFIVMWTIKGFKVRRLSVNSIVGIQTISVFAFMPANDYCLQDKNKLGNNSFKCED